MSRLLYLTALLLLTLLTVVPTAGAQGQRANEAETRTTASISLSGNGRITTNTFELGSGLVIVVVCGSSGGATTNEVNEADGAKTRVGGVEARAGGAVARVGGGVAEARAGGAIARSGGGNTTTTSQQGISSSEQVENRVSTNCAQRIETNRGDSDFVVNLLDEDGVRVGGNLASGTGSPEGLSQAVQTKAGRYVLDVRANGPWKIKIEQPRPSDAPQTTRFSGDHKTATDFFRLSRGTKRFEMTHQGSGKFSVQLLDKNGAKVGEKLVNKKGSFNGSELVQVPKDGVYLLQVEANGPWTIRLK